VALSGDEIRSSRAGEVVVEAETGRLSVPLEQVLTVALVIEGEGPE